MVGLLRARRHSNIVLMSACGTKPTFLGRSRMSAFGGKAEVRRLL
jgi:hypothetical protein